MDHGFPTAKEAEQELLIAEKMNPGVWVDHSRHAANACKNIAEHCKNMDAERAYAAGLLHDIGRRAGVFFERHLIEGYRYCMDKGWSAMAKICITHGFVIQTVSRTDGKWDVSDEEYDFISNFAQTAVYDEYDQLVQLCDCLALPSGFCILEQRFVDVARRYGVNEYTVPKWNAVYKIKDYFEDYMGCCLYSVLPGVKENAMR